MTEIIQPSASSSTAVNYYTEFHLDKDDSLEAIRKSLAVSKAQWGQRAALPGTRGDEARAQLALVAEAERAFSDDDARLAYDRSLRQAPTSEDEASVNWVNRAWTYYFVRDYGPAKVAARKARQHDADDPTAYVASAWIELAESEWKTAKGYADEAFVLDELGNDTFDVHKVRGVTFYFADLYDKSIESFERALAKAPDVMRADIYRRMSYTYRRMTRYDDALKSVLKGLEVRNLVEDEEWEALLAGGRLSISDSAAAGTSDSQNLGSIETMRGIVTSSSAENEAKVQLLGFIDKLKEFHELEAKTATEPNLSNRPGLPLIPGAVAVVFLLIFFGFRNFVVFLVFAAAAAWTGYTLYRRHVFDEQVKAYNSDVERRNNLLTDIKQIVSNSEKLY